MGEVQKYYVFIGADRSTIDFAHYQPSGQETIENPPRFLFTYAPDRAPDEMGHKDGQGPDWELYIGATRPVIGTPERDFVPRPPDSHEVSRQHAGLNALKAGPKQAE